MTRFRTNLIGKLILQVLIQKKTRNGSHLVWRDANFSDYQQMLADGAFLADDAEEVAEEKSAMIGFNTVDS